MDNEVHIEATATSDSGVTYGSYLEIEIGSDSSVAQNANVSVDEVNLFFSGNFGRVELGQQDGAEDVMFVGAEDAQSGTGGIDGDTSNLAPIINVQNTGDATKATYFTPRIAGFQLGASFTPDTSDNNGIKNNSGQENAIGIGGNWVGAFGGIDLTLSAVAISSQGESRQPTSGTPPAATRATSRTTRSAACSAWAGSRSARPLVRPSTALRQPGVRASGSVTTPGGPAALSSTRSDPRAPASVSTTTGSTARKIWRSSWSVPTTA